MGKDSDGDGEDATFIPDVKQWRTLRPRRYRPTNKLKDSMRDKGAGEDEENDENYGEDNDEHDDDLADPALEWKPGNNSRDEDEDEEEAEEEGEGRRKKKGAKRKSIPPKEATLTKEAPETSHTSGTNSKKASRRQREQPSASKTSAESKHERGFLSPEPVSDEQLKQIQQAFQLFDPNETGRILCSNVELAMNAIGLSCSEASTSRDDGEDNRAQGPSRSKKQRQNHVSLQEFEQRALDQMKELNLDREIRRVFRLLDKNADGRISLRDLRKVAKELELGMTTEELQEMIDEVDKDRDGQVGHDDFVSILTKTGLIA